MTLSLVTFNGEGWLPGCLASLRAQTLTDYELLVIDNASSDRSVDQLRSEANDDPRIRLVESQRNLGFARAHNQNIAAARGEFVFLINQDIELDPEFLREALASFDGRPTVGAVQGRVRGLDAAAQRTNILDTTGLQMQRDRRVVSRNQGDPDGRAYLTPGPVFGADGPAPVYRRAALVDARLPATGGGWEILDEDFFMYKEDVDLAWRLQLLGWTAWYAPTALAWHARGAGGPRARTMLEIARTNTTIPRWIKALSWRNQRLMQIKNELPSMYFRDLPWILHREILSLAFIVVADPKRLAAVPALIRALPAAMRKRRFVQRRRRASAADLRSWFIGD
ncbi:MAG: glycosyltransferase family 2 protein [Chloroflexota bacterium]